jgi:hypothetical protein
MVDAIKTNGLPLILNLIEAIIKCKHNHVSEEK